MLPDWTRTCHVPYVKKNLISVPSAKKLLVKTTSLANFTHACIISLRKQLTFGDATTCFPTTRCLRNERRNPILMMRHYPDLGSACDWLKIWFIQSQELARSGYWYVISMEFLRTFLRRHFVGKQVVASKNCGRFLLGRVPCSHGKCVQAMPSNFFSFSQGVYCKGTKSDSLGKPNASTSDCHMHFLQQMWGLSIIELTY